VSTVRFVRDDPPPVRCLRWTADDRDLCHLRRAHAGTCLPLPTPWPHMDITRENPRYVRSAA
jgi:hypothetical protein